MHLVNREADNKFTTRDIVYIARGHASEEM